METEIREVLQKLLTHLHISDGYIDNEKLVEEAKEYLNSNPNLYNPETAKEWLKYDRRTGQLRWNKKVRNRKIGDVAGSEKTGQLALKMRLYNLYDIIWILNGNTVPKGYSVHKIQRNAAPTIKNLKLIKTDSLEKTHPRNTTGHPGVHYYKKNGRWVGYLRKFSKTIYLGYFLTKEECIQAVEEAKIKFKKPTDLPEKGVYSNKGSK